jgi:hypothetical protein
VFCTREIFGGGWMDMVNPNLRDLARETKNPEVSLDLTKNTLVYSAYRYVYALLGKKTKILHKNDEVDIESLCFHDGALYHASKAGIRDIFTGRTAYINPCNNVCSNGEEMYHSHFNKIFKQGKRLCEVRDYVMALQVNENEVYYSAIDNLPNCLLSSFVVHGDDCSPDGTEAKCDRPISAICIHNNELYYTADNKLYRASREHSQKNEPIVKLPGKVNALVSVDDILYGIVEGGNMHCIMDMLNSKWIAETHMGVTDLIAVPTEYILKNMVK